MKQLNFPPVVKLSETTNLLGEQISCYRTGRIALCTQKLIFEAIRASEWLLPALKDIDVTIIDNFDSDPKTSDLSHLRRLHSEKFDAFIAIGGGSVIDMTKCLRLFQNLPSSVTEASYLQAPYMPKSRLVDFLAIPTTAGTGSEATPFAVMYHEKNKYSLDFPQMKPTHIYLIPELLISLPLSVRIPTAFDALSQAIESFWNVNSTSESDEFAVEAIKTIVPILPDFLRLDNEANATMQRGAYLAGCAIAITRTTAAHAISYPMNSHFCIPHGLGVALTLGEFFIYNMECNDEECNDPRGIDFVKARMRKLFSLLGVEDAFRAREQWRIWLGAAGISHHISDHGIKTPNDIEIIVRQGHTPSRVKNHPRKITPDSIRLLLQRTNASDAIT